MDSEQALFRAVCSASGSTLAITWGAGTEYSARFRAVGGVNSAAFTIGRRDAPRLHESIVANILSAKSRSFAVSRKQRRAASGDGGACSQQLTVDARRAGVRFVSTAREHQGRGLG